MDTKFRTIAVALIILFVSFGTWLIIKTFNDNILFFYSPTQYHEKKAHNLQKNIRIGGVVKKSSFKQDGLKNEFIITDYINDIQVLYSGMLPNLFKEGQGVVVLGNMQSNGSFVATEILAKHDENYMPPEIKIQIDEVKLK